MLLKAIRQPDSDHYLNPFLDTSLFGADHGEVQIDPNQDQSVLRRRSAN